MSLPNLSVQCVQTNPFRANAIRKFVPLVVMQCLWEILSFGEKLYIIKYIFVKKIKS